MCEFCKTFDFSTARTEINKLGTSIVTTLYVKIPEAKQFNYCPVCGEKIKNNNTVKK